MYKKLSHNIIPLSKVILPFRGLKFLLKLMTLDPEPMHYGK